MNISKWKPKSNREAYQTYGLIRSFSLTFFKKVNLLASFIIVGIYPVPLAILINKITPKEIRKTIHNRDN